MSLIEVKVPNIGDFADIPVIEVLVKKGDAVKAEDPLITLESDKATMEVPAPSAGKVSEILVNIGDKVSEGSLILKLESEGQATRATSGNAVPEQRTAPPPAAEPQRAPETAAAKPSDASPLPAPTEFGGVNASPSVRRLARELDIDLTSIKGSGEKGRITKADVKAALGGGPAKGNALAVPQIPEQDFAKFGPITVQPMTRLKRLSGPHLHRAWLNIPHVTHADEADITDLEIYRKQLDTDAKIKGYRVTMLPFLMMASVVALKQFPDFNASLAPDGESLILKHYYNIGVAVDTPDGLVVPVIKDVDRKRILELSQELAATSQRMREGKIAPSDIQGASFSISSLGGIGGTSFTPIVNAPEVAILGVARATIRPVWNGESFTPRLMLPLCVSFDHRVIDGALAARFASRLAEILSDVRQLVL
ncbi:2-oxo acid dehydrogenase subunit E2 [Hyphomicrobium sp.]|uniref:2-oxo acid dehydrogenase subunit E2 n=1 Tax=Hyphomicrobium sp. TaxID=82 RepID=UPI0025C60D34|nr:2-oxo acid dehydrogenase subunit E2 [Hyphomicrobium sp.]MCC7253964.1 2-oxo acid dehydrogenase subunit E2 [Hyphomicrobium sp.]